MTSSDSPEDLFESSLSSLFSQPIIAHSLPSSSSPFFPFSHPSLPGSLPLLLALPSDVPAALNSLQAQYIWPSSLYMAHLLATGEIALEGRDGRGPRVCELGAGAGLSSVVAARILSERAPAPASAGGEGDQGGGSSWVVCTDWGDAEILKVLEGNLSRNIREDGQAGWAVLGHQWGTDISSMLTSRMSSLASTDAVRPSSDGPFDVVLGADLLFRTDSHPALLSSISALLPPSPVPPLSTPSVSSPSQPLCHLTAGLHGGSRGAVDRFIARATSDEWDFEVEDQGIVAWDSREEAWRTVQEGQGGEAYGEGMVWTGVLRRRCR